MKQGPVWRYFRDISLQIWTCFPLIIHQHWRFTGAVLSFFVCFVQISGRKELFLYEPHQNSRLYEAHIQEASLAYNPVTKKFWRKELLESTSMVMSPVDILKPDYNRFPKFKEAQALNCTINEGDVLFMPSFWWHEVQSYPSENEPRNLAVNFWWVFFAFLGFVSAALSSPQHWLAQVQSVLQLNWFPHLNSSWNKEYGCIILQMFMLLALHLSYQ